MDIEELKAIPIAEYLASLGQHPQRQRADGQLYYRAFYRTQSDPKHYNLAVSQRLNRWHDFATDEKGSIIDLVMVIKRCGLHEAITTLSSYNGNTVAHCTPIFPPVDKMGDVYVSKVTHLYHTVLLDYLESRGISNAIAQKYCKLVYFTFDPMEKRKSLFAIGFENVSGGYSLRNGSPKGKICVPPNDISLIPHATNRDLMVFEGFISFLSHVQMYSTPTASVMVLNSVSNRNKESAVKAFSEASRVFLYLDNDNAGETATMEIKARYGAKCVDMRHTFKPHNDFNDYLMAYGR